MSQDNAHIVINQCEECACLECRVRRAVKGDDEWIDGNEAVNAIGNIFCELLAHMEPESAQHAIEQLHPAVAAWRQEPIVQNQLRDPDDSIGATEGNA